MPWKDALRMVLCVALLGPGTQALLRVQKLPCVHMFSFTVCYIYGCIIQNKLKAASRPGPRARRTWQLQLELQLQQAGWPHNPPAIPVPCWGTSAD